MSYLVQILLPLADNEGVAFPAEMFRDLQAELTSRFGGVTAYSRAPAKGVWAHNNAHHTDDIVTIEVMTDVLDDRWWQALRRRLETMLHQEEIVIRAQAIRTF